MQTFYLWISVLSILFGRGEGNCVADIKFTRYAGTVSVTNNGYTCQAWSSQKPHEHFVNNDLWFPDDGSVTAGRNYCRQIWQHAKPWCYTTHPDIRWGYCDFVICIDDYQICGEVFQNASGSIAAPDFDGDGLYDVNIDCLWTVQAPEDYVIRYVIQYFEIEDSWESGCILDALMIFERGRTERLNYCGSSGTYQMEGETLLNILYVQFYSDFSVTGKGFNITFRQIKAPNKACGEVLTQTSGWIASPDLDGDGLYDFNLNCSWTIKVEESTVIAFRLIYMEIVPSDDCKTDYLLIYDTQNYFVGYCHHFVAYGEAEFVKTASNVLFVDFGSNNVNTRKGFKLEYEQATKHCLDDLTGYNGTVSVTNHGYTCQAWSSQTPHQNIYNEDSWFPIDGSVTEASNYCRDVAIPGRPWCYTTDPEILWNYCTFRICNNIASAILCGGLIQNTTGYISPREPSVLEETINFDCLWTIKADEHLVIRYNLLIYEEIDDDQCQAVALILFEKGEPLIARTFCDGLYMSVDGETRSNVLNIRYYKDKATFFMDFLLIFEHAEAQEKNLNKTLRNPSGWITSPDRDGNNLYDFNVNCLWTIEGDPRSVILLQSVYIRIEKSPGCIHDYIRICDTYGLIIALCGLRNDTGDDIYVSRGNRMHIQFITDGLISARGFNFSYEMVSSSWDDDCLLHLLESTYTGTVSVTNHGITCQAWASQTPHQHFEAIQFEDYNYCRNHGTSPLPWCYTMDPYIRWQYCSFSICNGTNQVCGAVLESTTGFIFSPDYNNDGLYDLNVDCLWIVEATGDHVIKFHIYYVYMESSPYCSKDLLQITERKYDATITFICGHFKAVQTGETLSSALYVQFYSDDNTPDRGFNMSYLHVHVPNKHCTETYRNESGWITAPDRDGDGFYDFNLNCFWTVEVEFSKLIRYQVLYVDLDYQHEESATCLTDTLTISDEFGELSVLCGVIDEMFPRETMETRSNVMFVQFTSNNMMSAIGFNLTYVAFERNSSCFDKLKSSPYSGTVSVTNNGQLCQAWSDQTPHNHSQNKDALFPDDESVSGAKNYCRDIWGDGRPWCYTTDQDIRWGFCNFRICDETLQSCGDMLHSPTGTIVSPDSNNNGFYDQNVDCLWIVVAADNEVIRYKIDNYDIEDSSGCHKDSLSISECGAGDWRSFCGQRAERIDGETVSNKLCVQFYSDESVVFRGFQLTFLRRLVTNSTCGGIVNDTYGWISSPDTDGDGLYDFNVRCQWKLEFRSSKQIKYQVLYALLEPCHDDTNDYLYIFENALKNVLYCGEHSEQEQPRVSTSNLLFIEFSSNNLFVEHGFNITYEEVAEQVINYEVTGDGWIRAPDFNEDGLYDNFISCTWIINVLRNHSIELEIHFLKIDGIHPVCDTDKLLITVWKRAFVYTTDSFCGMPRRQAVMNTGVHFASIHFISDYMINDSGFLLSHKEVNVTKTGLIGRVLGPGWISSLDADLNGQYDYHVIVLWKISAVDSTNNIMLKLLYMDIEESQGCAYDYLSISGNLYMSVICGTAVNILFTPLANTLLIKFRSDHTINGVGFNMTFVQITSVINYECDVVLTSSSEYITSMDINGDGLYDGGEDCMWTIELGYIYVIVFEVLKQDIHQNERSLQCENDFLRIYEDHREIGRYCGKITAPGVTTESNILHVLFSTDLFRSGKGFEAVYFQAEDSRDCLSDYTCISTDRAIQQNHICDTYRDCPYGDDERFCHFRCPPGCVCTGLSVDCTGRYECESNRKPASSFNQTFVLNSTTRILDISSNPDMFLSLNLAGQDLVFLTHLNLSSCEITDLPVDIFLSMKNLKVMDLSFNRLRHLKAKTFLNQANLELLLLKGNSESLSIESEAFVGLVSLQYLNLNILKIERISKGSFATLHLKKLTIYHSHILEMESVSLDKLYVEAIFLNSSSIDTFTETMFHGGTGTNIFVTDKYKYCCVRPLSVQEENCYPQKDEFSSCDDLIKHKILRPLILVIGLFCLLSNVISVIYRFRFHAEQLKLCYGIAVVHLAGSDSLLGLYLIIIGITDNIFRGIYIFHDDSWRSSAWCQLAGVLSTVSSEASVLFSFLITVDRLLVIKYPFGEKRLTRRNGTVLAIVFWSATLFLAVLPFILPSHFKGEFYSKSGLCLALPLTNARQTGWGYAFGIFVVFNSLACLLIAIGQWTIYREIKSSKKAVGDGRSKSSTDSRVARNLLLVVTTNFLCWLPVGFLGVMAMADYPIPVNVYSWIAVVVLPINSAVNPILYTLSEILQKKKVVPRAEDSKKIKYNLSAGDLNKCTGLWKSSGFWSFEGQAPGYTSLTEVLGAEWFCRKERLSVSVGICQLLHKLHDWKIIQEDLTIDDVFIRKTTKHRCKVALLCRPQQMLKVSDRNDNLLSLGLVLSTLNRVG